MQRQLTMQRLSEEEEVKAAGLTLDFDEMAKRGSMSKEEGLIAKWYGIYGSRQPGSNMARVVIPGGVFTAVQARRLADVAERFGRGRVCVTTRQALQFHYLKVSDLPAMLRELGQDGLSTFHGCGDVTRTVAACPCAEECPHRRLDVRPYARAVGRELNAMRDLDNLPRKYKITFSGCEAGCAQPWMNCVGVMAVRAELGGEARAGFRVVIGGGMGWKAFVAQPLFAFVPPERIVAVCRAVGLLFRDHGDRFNRARSRLKFVVDRFGIDACRDLVLGYLWQEGVPVSEIRWGDLAYHGPTPPERPLTDSEVARWEGGGGIVRIRVPKGELGADQLRRIAELSEMYGNQRVYSTNRQNLELHGVAPDKLAAARAEVERLGFATDGVSGLRDMVCCVGTEHCPKAVASTRTLFDLLQPVVSDAKYRAAEERAAIHITGCPNSCSPYRIADIGFRGLRQRLEQGSAEGFEVLIGGDQRAHGTKLGEFRTEECPAVVAALLDTFLARRLDGETLSACVARVGLEPFSQAVFT
jgi:sulfite reductase beta subunit-like hemoprotein